MRVAIVSFRVHTHGGVERYAYELVRHLAQKVEVHIFAHEVSDGIDGVVHTIPSIGSRDLFSVNSYMVFLKENLHPGDFDIIHSMGPLYLHPDVVTAHICQKRLLKDSPLFFSSYSLLRKSYWNIRSTIASSFQKRSFLNAKRVIAVSSMLEGELKKEYGLKNTVVLYPGIESTFFEPIRETVLNDTRREWGIGSDTKTVLFVGSQWERKGLQFLIRALSKMEENYVLLVIGRGDLRRYRNIAEEHGVQKRIIFAGFKKDIHAFYSISDVLVLPSLYEPFGYPVLEAMACGLPVVTSAHVGAAELVEEGKNGSVVRNVRNAKDLSHRIELWCEKISPSIKERNISKVHSFLWEKKVEGILSLYAEIMKNAKD
jgi:UDP-glucose:(heptosyl)LPS alpha-1,3-glucosyltransferase